MVDVLIGIDLSEKMIRQAKEKNVYDELIVSDLANGLKILKTNFDLFISADVFAYIGDLASLFDSVKKHANNESLFIFSTEDIPGDGFFYSKLVALHILKITFFQLPHILVLSLSILNNTT